MKISKSREKNPIDLRSWVNPQGYKSKEIQGKTHCKRQPQWADWFIAH